MGVLVLYRALRMQSSMCQVLLFCSHQNQCSAGFHDIVMFKNQIQVTELTSPNIHYTSLLTAFHKLTTRDNTDFSQYRKKGLPGYLMYLCNTSIFHMIICFTESVKMITRHYLHFLEDCFFFYITTHYLQPISLFSFLQNSPMGNRESE